jgi:hypothetical protein
MPEVPEMTTLRLFREKVAWQSSRLYAKCHSTRVLCTLCLHEGLVSVEPGAWHSWPDTVRLTCACCHAMPDSPSSHHHHHVTN